MKVSQDTTLFLRHHSCAEVRKVSTSDQSMSGSLTMWVVDSREIFLVIRLAKCIRDGREEGGPESKSSLGL